MLSRLGTTLWFGQVREEHGFALVNSINYVIRFPMVNVTYNCSYHYFEGLTVLIIIGPFLTLCMCISLTEDFTPVWRAYGDMGQLGRVQLPVKRVGIYIVRSFCAESFF